MEHLPRVWRLERHEAVRADAEGLFVRAADLPGADVGDQVIVDGYDGERTGTIAETDERAGERFYRVDLRR